MNSAALKIFNDINALYEQDLIFNGEKYACPVCKKEYKSEKRARKHLDKQDCFSYVDLLKNTLLEIKIFQLYKDLIASVNPRARATLQSFRKGTFYRSTSKFVIFCHIHEVKVMEDYITWLNQEKGFDMIQKILSQGIKESTLREYRSYQRKNEQIASEPFYEKYRDDLIEDGQFLTRSLEKSHISIRYLATRDDFPFEEILSNLPRDYQNRVEGIASEVLG